MKYLQIISTVLSLLPSVIQAIKAIEDAIPGAGKGEAKISAIRQIIEACDAGAKELWPVLQKVIGILVATFNSVGVFSKGAES